MLWALPLGFVVLLQIGSDLCFFSLGVAILGIVRPLAAGVCPLWQAHLPLLLEFTCCWQECSWPCVWLRYDVGFSLVKAHRPCSYFSLLPSSPYLDLLVLCPLLCFCWLVMLLAILGPSNLSPLFFGLVFHAMDAWLCQMFWVLETGLMWLELQDAPMSILARADQFMEKTKRGREKLLDSFSQWLLSNGVSFEDFLNAEVTDLDMVNLLLEKYGRELFKAGRPYGHYSELVNAVGSLRPRFRRSLQGAWDLAYSWLRHEPPSHHVALPWQPMVALLVTSFCWGWVRVAGVIALSWGALTTIGEVLAASRGDLVLPSDLRGARHQVARLDQPDLLKVIEAAFARLPKNARLWPFSGQTLRKRFYSLLGALKLPSGSDKAARGIDLGSLRAGGATWLLDKSEHPELVRRRGRWISAKIMEFFFCRRHLRHNSCPCWDSRQKISFFLEFIFFPRCFGESGISTRLQSLRTHGDFC